jgi:hypothetical protein
MITLFLPDEIVLMMFFLKESNELKCPNAISKLLGSELPFAGNEKPIMR